MFVLVIFLHCSPMLLPGQAATELPPRWAVLLLDLCRCAVPYFFIASGYFLNLERPTAEVARRAAARILSVYVFWTAAYVVLVLLVYRKGPALTPDLLLGGGEGYHLWFLPALVGGQVLVSFLMRQFGAGITAAVVLALYVAGPILYAWHGLFGFEYHWRLVPLVRHLAAPACIFLGIALRRMPDWRPPIWLGLSALALVLLVAEEIVLNRTLGQARVTHDFLWSTLPFGACVFQFAKSFDALERLAPIGQMTLGLYAVHMAFVWFFSSFIPTASPPGLALVVAAVAVSSLLVIALMRRSPVLARFVQ